ncbi:MAG: nucleotidyltransferase domain-containing protein [Gemmatimonadales bacterium]
MRTRTLTVRGIPDASLKRLRARATANRRSLNGELLEILDAAAAAEAPRLSHAARAVREPATEPYQALGSPQAPLLTSIDRKALAAICRRYHIRWLAVFGSHAHGRARPDSDVDVVVDFAPGKTPGFGMVRVAEALRPVFGGRHVDLVTRRGLSPRLREGILKSAQALHAAE